MKLERQAIEKIAALARLQLRGDEIDALQSQLSSVLTYVEQLNELDTENIAPTIHLSPDATPTRNDEPQPCLAFDDIFRNAPDFKGTAFRVPRILE